MTFDEYAVSVVRYKGGRSRCGIFGGNARRIHRNIRLSKMGPSHTVPVEEYRSMETEHQPEMSVYDESEWDWAFPEIDDNVHCPDPDCEYCNQAYGPIPNPEQS